LAADLSGRNRGPAIWPTGPHPPAIPLDSSGEGTPFPGKLDLPLDLTSNSCHTCRPSRGSTSPPPLVAGPSGTPLARSNSRGGKSGLGRFSPPGDPNPSARRRPTRVLNLADARGLFIRRRRRGPGGRTASSDPPRGRRARDPRQFRFPGGRRKANRRVFDRPRPAPRGPRPGRGNGRTVPRPPARLGGATARRGPRAARRRSGSSLRAPTPTSP